MNLDENTKQELRELRHQKGLYSTSEIRAMFDIGKVSMDFILNSGKVKWMSPNNREKFVYLDDFIKYILYRK